MMYHNPVLLNESVEGLRIDPDGVYADLTFGGGGHSRAILERLSGGRLVAFDQDPQAAANAIDDPRFTLVGGNFRYLTQFLRYHDALPVDGILADLGVSSHQIDSAHRGFSTRSDAPLDMRMDTELSQSAATLLQRVEVDELDAILRNYGEVSSSRRIARAIVSFRERHAIDTTFALKEAVASFVPARFENKFMAKLFQAIRIAVNDEIESLREMLLQCYDVLRPGGRLVVISYHSIEDRLVKHFLRTGNLEDRKETDFFGKSNTPFRVITRKAVTPSPEELKVNSRARSARLRIGEKI